MVRRRRNQAHAGYRVARLGDDRIHLVPRQLTALARLCALRHLDLQLVGIHQVIRRHAEAATGHLLHRRAPRVAIGVRLEALFFFTALAGVGHSAQPVHGDRQRLVRFLADRPIAHCACREALDDLFGWLDFLQRNGIVGVLQLHQSAQRTQVAILIVQQIGVLLEGLRIVLAHRLLQLADGLRILQVILAADAELILPADHQLGLRFGQRLESILVLQQCFARQHLNAHAFDARSRAGEVSVD